MTKSNSYMAATTILYTLLVVPSMLSTAQQQQHRSPAALRGSPNDSKNKQDERNLWWWDPAEGCLSDANCPVYLPACRVNNPNDKTANECMAWTDVYTPCTWAQHKAKISECARSTSYCYLDATNGPICGAHSSTSIGIDFDHMTGTIKIGYNIDRNGGDMPRDGTLEYIRFRSVDDQQLHGDRIYISGWPDFVPSSRPLMSPNPRANIRVTGTFLPVLFRESDLYPMNAELKPFSFDQPCLHDHECSSGNCAHGVCGCAKKRDFFSTNKKTTDPFCTCAGNKPQKEAFRTPTEATIYYGCANDDYMPCEGITNKAGNNLDCKGTSVCQCWKGDYDSTNGATCLRGYWWCIPSGGTDDGFPCSFPQTCASKSCFLQACDTRDGVCVAKGTSFSNPDCMATA